LEPRSEVVAVTKPNYVVLKTLELVCGRNLEKFGNADYRVLKSCKQSLMDDYDGNLED
jgi:hypothetical protein